MSHIRQSLARSMRCWVAAGLVLATLVGAQVNAASDAEAADSPSAGFYDGLVKYSDIISCQSIIFPPTYTEKGAAAYVGGYADPESGIPAVGQTFYVHVVVYGLGNACSGQRFIPAFSLPSGVTFDTVQPILCFTSNGQATGPTDCPQWGNVSASTFGPGVMYRSTDTANANAWPLPQGYFWEFRFPVTSSTIQTNANLRGYVKMFDGNDSPVLNPSAPLYVFGAGSPPAVMHDRPSTVASEFLPRDDDTVGLRHRVERSSGGERSGRDHPLPARDGVRQLLRRGLRLRTVWKQLLEHLDRLGRARLR